MYPILVSGDSILGAKVSGLISGDLRLEWRFIWVSGRDEKHGDASAWSEKEWCVDMHGFLRP